MRKQNTLKNLSFADLIAMRKAAVELKYEKRRKYDKWQRVHDALNQEIERRLKAVDNALQAVIR